MGPFALTRHSSDCPHRRMVTAVVREVRWGLRSRQASGDAIIIHVIVAQAQDNDSVHLPSTKVCNKDERSKPIS